MGNVPKPQILRLRNRFGEELKELEEFVTPEIGLTNKNDGENLMKEESTTLLQCFCTSTKQMFISRRLHSLQYRELFKYFLS